MLVSSNGSLSGRKMLKGLEGSAVLVLEEYLPRVLRCCTDFSNKTRVSGDVSLSTNAIVTESM